MMPSLGRIDPVPGGDLAAQQQKIDEGRGGAPVGTCRIAKGLAIEAAFRMRLQIEQANDLLRVGLPWRLLPAHARFLRSRRAAKTLAGSPPARPTLACTAGSAGAQKRIGGEFEIHPRRQGKAAGSAQRRDFGFALLQILIGGIDAAGEARIGERIFMPAIDLRRAGQGRELHQGMIEHFGRRLEAAAAAHGEERIAGKQQPVALRTNRRHGRAYGRALRSPWPDAIRC